MNTIDRIALRFKSGNNTPVERAHITAEEWAAIKALVGAAAVGTWSEFSQALSALTEDKG